MSSEVSRVPAYVLGAAQRSYHDVDVVDHPLELMRSIAAEAMADAALAPGEVDAVAVVDPFSWTYTDLGERLASELGCGPGTRTVWRPAGGTTPLDLLHTVASAMADGEMDVALLVGAEAMRTRRKAARAGRELPWPERDRSVDPMRGQRPFTSPWEAHHGFRLPIHVFPAIENALCAEHGRTAEEQMSVAAELLARNARVAAHNPHAWFQDAPTAGDIRTVTPENRMIAFPYTKRMNSIMDVDQAAAVVVVSQRRLESRPRPDRAVAILGGAGAEEVWNPLERPMLARSEAMEVAFSAALDAAGVTVEDLTALDLYSCFPSAVQLALDALGIDIDDARPVTLTGGLAFAGGPGNNYVMHSLATAVDRLRSSGRRPGGGQDDTGPEVVMVTGIGMANTKHAATVLAAADDLTGRATGATTFRVGSPPDPLPVAERANGPATVVTYTAEYDRDGVPTQVIYLLDTPDGQRAIANAEHPEPAAEELTTTEPIGRSGALRWDESADRQFFTLD